MPDPGRDLKRQDDHDPSTFERDGKAETSRVDLAHVGHGASPMTIDRLSPAFMRFAAQRSTSAIGDERAVAASSQGDGVAPESGTGTPARDPKALRRQIAAIMRDGSDDPDPSTLRPRMIRAVLLWEFGPDIREHADWRDMVDAVDRAMADDPRMGIEFHRVVAAMRR